MLKRNKLTFEGHFTQIPNAWLRDQRLSYKARGILAILMSHEIGWRTSVNQLCGENDSRDAIKSGIRELEKYGYLIREQKQNAVTGKFESGVWILSNPLADEPLTENPLTENPLTANPPTKNTNSKNNIDKEIIVAENQQRFDEFWKIYPHRPNDAKAAAKKTFARLSVTNQKLAIEAAKKLADNPSPPEFRPMAKTWLNQERWLDQLETEVDGVAKEGNGLPWL